MTLSRFKIQVLTRVILLVLFFGTGMYLIFKASSLFLGGVLLVVGFLTVLSLFNVVNKTNRSLANFLMSIKYDDFETNYAKSNQEESEKALFSAFNLISTKFRDIRLEKEIQFQYFQTLVERVETGLIGFDQDGKTIFMNKALQLSLHKSFFPTFSSIAKYDEGLYALLQEMKSGERKLFKKEISQETIQLNIGMTQLKVKENLYSIYSFQNIHAELQAQEIKSWQKLIRILTHEIMNSVSPVVSLANSMHDLLRQDVEIEGETREEVQAAIGAIQKRSEGLMKFTETYRRLTKVPLPKLESTDAVELMNRVLTLMQPIMSEKEIVLHRNFAAKEMPFRADVDQLEQVFINLIKNAIEAVHQSTTKEITVGIESRDARMHFRIADSGPGIPREILDQIFIPFFTTKRDGSGIGLSLCRQIVYQHGGSLSVYSPEEGGTLFIASI